MKALILAAIALVIFGIIGLWYLAKRYTQRQDKLNQKAVEEFREHRTDEYFFELKEIVRDEHSPLRTDSGQYPTLHEVYLRVIMTTRTHQGGKHSA